MTIKVLAEADDRRESSRQHIEKLLPLSLTRDQDGRAVSSRLADISREGLGVMTFENLQIDQELTLQLLRHDLSFYVAWCEQQVDGMYLCGLVLKSKEIDLKDLFHGLLQNPQAS